MKNTKPQNPFAQEESTPTKQNIERAHQPIEERAFGPIIGIIIIIYLDYQSSH